MGSRIACLLWPVTEVFGELNGVMRVTGNGDPPGQWNQAELTVDGEMVTVRMNGRFVNSARTTETRGRPGGVWSRGRPRGVPQRAPAAPALRAWPTSDRQGLDAQHVQALFQDPGGEIAEREPARARFRLGL